MAKANNTYWNGSNGKLWLNDSTFEKVKSFALTMKIDWEEMSCGLATERTIKGYSYTGSFTYVKTDNNHTTILDTVFDDYSEGTITNITIIGKAYNPATSKTEKIKISGITFDELQLQKWEEKSITEVEMAFSASAVKIL
jgi:hypothetical protein